jgi:hypothetical protein
LIFRENGTTIGFEKEASGLRLFHGLHGVQKVGSSNLPAPTIASTNAVATFYYLRKANSGPVKIVINKAGYPTLQWKPA